MGLNLTIPGGPGVLRGPCPFCGGGEDRFAVWVGTGGFHCRRCGEKGGFRRLFELVLGLDPAAAAAKARRYADARGDAPPPDLKPNEVVDPDAWQKTVWRLIEDGEEDLAESEDALTFLHAERGLSKDTIRRYRLGCIQRCPPLWRSTFGLKPSYQRPDGTKVWKVVIPDGIIVPHIVRGRGVVSLTIRRWDGTRGRYRSLTGSKPEASYIAATNDAFSGVVAVVESALCGMKLSQDTGVAVVALGGVNAPLGPEAAHALDQAESIVLALDDDPAGMEAARGYEAEYSRAVYVPAPGGKDVTDAWRNGNLDLKKFVAAAVRRVERELRSRSQREVVPSPPLTREHVPNAPPAVPRAVPPAPSSAAVEPAVTACPQPRGFHLIANVAEAVRAVEMLTAKNVTVAISVKTARVPEWATHIRAGLDPILSSLRLVALGAKRGDAILIDCNACYGALPEILEPLLSGRLVAHDCVHAWKHLAHAGVPVDAMESTQLMWNALTNETTNPDAKDPTNSKYQVLSLESVLHRAVGVNIFTEGIPSGWDGVGLTQEQLQRAALEVHLLPQLYDELLRRLRLSHVESVYKLMRSAIAAIVQIETNGMPFDLARHAALVNEWRQRRDAVRAELPQGVDLRTQEGMDEAQRELLPSEVVARGKRLKSGLLSSSKGAMAELGHSTPALAKLAEWKGLDKLVSTYGDRFAAAVGPDGRIRSSYELAGTISGRLASHMPALQNIPRDRAFRALFTPKSEGDLLVIADMSFAECRVLACLANESRMNRAFEAGHDLYIQTASHLLHIQPEEVTKEQRKWARSVVFAFAFGQSPGSFMKGALRDQGLAMTLDEAKRIKAAFLSAYPRVCLFQERNIQSAQNYGQTVTPGGRVRRFEPGDRKAITAALNHTVQGGLAEVFLHILALLPGRLEGLGRLVNVVHDEVVVECSRETADEVVKVVEKTMADGFLAVFPNGCVRNLTEAKVCNTWADAK